MMMTNLRVVFVAAVVPIVHDDVDDDDAFVCACFFFFRFFSSFLPYLMLVKTVREVVDLGISWHRATTFAVTT